MNAKANSKGLGKGLSALMGEEYSQINPSAAATEELPHNAEGLRDVSVELIHSGEFQPRTHFDEAYLNELADSIEKNGVMQPIIVRPSPDHADQYEIIAGERRWRASKLAKIETIPCLVRDIDDQLALELALVENIQRQDLNVLEEAGGYQRLIDEFGYTQEELAHTVGKSRSHIANLLRLLALPKRIKTYLESGELSMGHARALLNVDNAEKLAEQVVTHGLNVRQTEQFVKDGDLDAASAKPATPATKSAPKGSAKGGGTTAAKDKDPDIIALEEALSDNLGLSVSINDMGQQTGQVVIRYEALTQLDEILRRLGNSF